MRLTVLGCYGSFPGPGGACSGYLVRHNGANILFDCGNGVISRAQQFIQIEDIDAIVLSHLHMDHIADIFVLKYALESKIAVGQKLKRIKLLMPEKDATRASELYDGKLFDIKIIEEDLDMKVKDIKLSFKKVPHLIECYSITALAGNSKLVYSGDTGYSEKLSDIAAEADIFLCEATLVSPVKGFEHHLSAVDAAKLAAQAKAKQLLLTHLWYETAKGDYISAARKIFKNTDIAEEFKSYEV